MPSGLIDLQIRWKPQEQHYEVTEYHYFKPYPYGDTEVSWQWTYKDFKDMPTKLQERIAMIDSQSAELDKPSPLIPNIGQRLYPGRYFVLNVPRPKRGVQILTPSDQLF